MFLGKKVSVVLATYRERKTVRRVINEFFETGFVDEVVVVENNAEKGTEEEVKKTKARLVHEPRQGYGYAFQKGIEEARGDLIVLCEPDGTFQARDLERFLIYAKEFDIVLGSRTGQNTPLSGADMTVTRKFANVIEAKTIEVLFNTNALTDIGCTYKLFRKKAIKKLKPLWRTRNSLFATELVLLTVSENMHFIEIPVTFKKRVGKSAFVEKFQDQAKWAIRIQLYILSFWFRWISRRIFNV
ncbi:MAG: Glycosyl transferase, family 2 [Candidatus Woesebacteria bacterium GW2011_GWB1_41_10]|uniref:Glycosyl transferase, family 2 n=1 Tax=Candidatus Woesebacteria bacterium GW2011_GWB1_41_10 TaxID=1618577 RepID=A0A0G0UAL7_9BACT|nr:MAG: Glycosyl transferase, family 2 [Candidatus Woesebacteria bacterium GW2011_GWB1_41_10]